MKAYKLYNTPDGGTAFITGSIPDVQRIPVSALFFEEDKADRTSFAWHPAPRRQYVITLKGTLEFTVTDGSSFVVHPGDVLIAADISGTGHQWRILGSDSWSRAYIVIAAGEEDGFVADRDE